MLPNGISCLSWLYLYLACLLVLELEGPMARRPPAKAVTLKQLLERGLGVLTDHRSCCLALPRGAPLPVVDYIKPTSPASPPQTEQNLAQVHCLTFPPLPEASTAVASTCPPFVRGQKQAHCASCQRRDRHERYDCKPVHPPDQAGPLLYPACMLSLPRHSADLHLLLIAL